MYSFAINSIKSKLKDKLKESFTKLKDGIRKMNEDFRVFSDPRKTSYKYEKSYFFEMNKGIKETDMDFRNWKNWSIMKFASRGFGVQHSLTQTNEQEEITSITIDFQKIIKYDISTQRIWEQRLYQQRYWEEKLKKELEEPKWWEGEKALKPSGRIWEKEGEKQTKEERGQLPPEKMTEVNIEGTLLLFIDYKKGEINVRLLLDYKDPQIKNIDTELVDNIINVIDVIVVNLSILLYSEFSSFEISRLMKKIESIPEEDVRKEISDVVEAFYKSQKDISLTQKEINVLLKEIKEIPDPKLRDEILELVDSLQKVQEPSKQQTYYKKIKKIIESYISKE